MNIYKLRIFVFNLFKSIIGKKASMKMLFKLKQTKLEKSDIIYIHIPKAGGTSIAHTLYGERIGHFSISNFIDFWGWENVQKRTVFAVVRNPYERLYSAYNFVKSGGTKDGSVSNLNLYKGPQFNNFNTFVQDWLVKQDLLKLDVLFRPQTFFTNLPPNKNLKIHFFKLEDLGKTEAFLSQLLNKDVKIGKKNQNLDSKKSKLYSNIDEKSIQIINQLYNQDFIEFDYEKLELPTANN